MGVDFLVVGPPPVKLLIGIVLESKQNEGGIEKSWGFKFRVPEPRE